MIIFSFDFDKAVGRLRLLRCSLQLLRSNLGKYTPIHTYLWVNESSYDAYDRWLTESKLADNFFLMKIQAESWTSPRFVYLEDAQWAGKLLHSRDYYIMGRWRLLFSFPFVKQMGYQYLLQIDDDTLVLDPIPFNIVDYFNSHNIAMGVRRQLHTEGRFVVAGLLEFTK
jgi:hypothetical protein